MTVLQVSPSDQAGGAERIALSLHQAYRRSGVAAHLAVGRKTTHEADVLMIDNEKFRNWYSRALKRWAHDLFAANLRGLKGGGRLASFLVRIAEPLRQWKLSRGMDDFDFPASRRLLDLIPTESSKVIHCHNLHGGYFDLRTLPTLSRKAPVFLTLHDGWLLSGHCAHGGSCERWRVGCGECPDLGAYPPVPRDATRQNWHRRARFYAESRLNVATPCQWLMDMVNASMLRPAIVSQRVIPNGIDLSVFHPASQQEARRELGIPSNRPVLLFAAYNVRSNTYKDYECLQAAVDQVANAAGRGRILFLAVGESATEERMRNAEVRFIPFQRSPERMAQFYRAADIYLHAAKSDTFPTAILEAMACGTPVIATAVGGIPEQVQHGVTGFLTPPGDPTAMAVRIAELLDDPVRLQAMATQTATVARHTFGLERMSSNYLDWYQEVIESQRASAPK